MNSNLSYFLSRVSAVSTQTFKLEPQNSNTAAATKGPARSSVLRTIVTGQMLATNSWAILSLAQSLWRERALDPSADYPLIPPVVSAMPYVAHCLCQV